MKEKILSRELVEKLGLNKVSVITADMLDGYTSIGDYTFCWCNRLSSVTIPNSVTSIGIEAFQSCTGLTSVTIPNSISNIGDNTFKNCNSLTSIKIPNSVTIIGNSAFEGCKSLTSVKIPNSVKSIGGYAFYHCTSLTSVTIPNSVTSIGTYAFQGCSSLSSVTIPNSVTSIEAGAFSWCDGLTSVTIGDKTYKKQTVTNGKCKAYKAFNTDMTCRGFQYKEGESYELDDEPILCVRGFHACLSLSDIFTYYHGELGKDVVVHEVELKGVSNERRSDSKVVAKKITIGKRIL